MDDNSQKKAKSYKRFTKKMQARYLLVFCTVILFFLFLIGKIVYIINKDTYSKSALSLQSYISSVVPYKRGNILDRNGQVLATSEKNYNLILDPKVILYSEKYIEPTISALVNVYGFDAEEANALINNNSDRSYVVIKKDLSYDEKNMLSEYISGMGENGKYVKGLWFEEKYERVYPYNELASHVIGFTLSDGNGTYGVEQYYNDFLKGTDGQTYGYYDNELNIVENKKESVPGNNIVLTIDVNVQRTIQKYAEEFLDELGAENIGIVVMDAANGEVLGMQSNYSYNLNSPRDLSFIYSDSEIDNMSDEETVNSLYAMWRNFCISDAYEPGSVYKIFTVASALEEAKTDINSTWLCDGGEDFEGDLRIKCSNLFGHGNITLTKSLMVSCNDALMQIAALCGRSDFYKYQKLFGMGRVTGIDLPGEAAGQIFKESELNETELATSSFGQGFTATMIQLTSAFCSAVNGGTYYEPHVLKKITTDLGTVLKENKANAVSKTMSDDTSGYLKEALIMTVKEGTGQKAKINGYIVGGKTGTSQKLPRDEEKYVVSFMGNIETDDRNIVMYVVIDECHNSEYATRCATAMKIFSDAASEFLPYLGIYSDENTDYEFKYIDPENVGGTIYDPDNAGEVYNVLTR